MIVNVHSRKLENKDKQNICVCVCMYTTLCACASEYTLLCVHK